MRGAILALVAWSATWSLGCTSLRGGNDWPHVQSAGRPIARAASDTLDARPAVSLGAPVPMAAEAETESGQPLDSNGEPLVLASPGWRSDSAFFLSLFRDDVEAVIQSENLLTLLAAGGVSFAFHELLDDDVADATRENPNRWGKFQDVVGGVGNPLHHLAAASGLYAYSLLQEDAQLHMLSQSLFNAAAITTVSATLLKFVANTERPNGAPQGWPSGHTASSVAMAAVLNEYYGQWVGLPAYTLAGLVAWERIDDREHDLSDIVFGAALGYVVGRTVARRHRAHFCGFQVDGYVDAASGTSGLGLERRF